MGNPVVYYFIIVYYIDEKTPIICIYSIEVYNRSPGLTGLQNVLSKFICPTIIHSCQKAALWLENNVLSSTTLFQNWAKCSGYLTYNVCFADMDRTQHIPIYISICVCLLHLIKWDMGYPEISDSIFPLMVDRPFLYIILVSLRHHSQ